MPNLDPEVVGAFIDEVSGSLEELNEAFLFLESARLSGTDISHKIHDIFRRLHSIKGAAGMLKFTRINQLTHKAETVLDLVRSRKLDCTPEVLKLLFRVLDTEWKLLEEIKNGHEKENLEALLFQMDTLIQVTITQDELRQTEKPERLFITSTPTLTPDTIKIPKEKVEHLMDLAMDLMMCKASLENRTKSVPSMELISLERSIKEVQKAVRELRLISLSSMFGRFKRVVRDYAHELEKEIELEVEGEEIEVDKPFHDALIDPLNHLIRNAADHGIEEKALRVAAKKREEGKIQLKAYRKDGRVWISVKDDGQGMDCDKIRKRAVEGGFCDEARALAMTPDECFNLVCFPGFTTAEKVTAFSGRGVGMDIVKRQIESLKGTLKIESRPGIGTEVLLSVPSQLSSYECLLCKAGNILLAIPLESVQEVAAEGKRTLPLVKLVDVFRSTPAVSEIAVLNQIVYISSYEETLGLQVEAILGKEEILVQSIPEPLGKVEGFAGVSLLENGKAAWVLDVSGFIHAALET